MFSDTSEAVQKVVCTIVFVLCVDEAVPPSCEVGPEVSVSGLLGFVEVVMLTSVPRAGGIGKADDVESARGLEVVAASGVLVGLSAKLTVSVAVWNGMVVLVKVAVVAERVDVTVTVRVELMLELEVEVCVVLDVDVDMELDDVVDEVDVLEEMLVEVLVDDLVVVEDEEVLVVAVLEEVVSVLVV